MAFRQEQIFCPTCERLTLHQKEYFSGGMGCLLTILTAGLFLPLWLIIDLTGLFSPWRCQTCGASNKR